MAWVKTPKVVKCPRRYRGMVRAVRLRLRRHTSDAAHGPRLLTLAGGSLHPARHARRPNPSHDPARTAGVNTTVARLIETTYGIECRRHRPVLEKWYVS